MVYGANNELIVVMPNAKEVPLGSYEYMSEYTIAHGSPLLPCTLQVYGGSPLIGSLLALQDPPAHGQGVPDTWDAVDIVAIDPEGVALLIVAEITSPSMVAFRTAGLPL